MKYLKIQTVVTDPKLVEEWINNRLEKQSALLLKNGQTVIIRREQGATTEYKLVEAD